MLSLSTTSLKFINSSSSMAPNIHFLRVSCICTPCTTIHSQLIFQAMCEFSRPKSHKPKFPHLYQFLNVLWEWSQNRSPLNGRPGQHHPCSDDIQLNLRYIKHGVYLDLLSWTPQLFWSSPIWWLTTVSWSLSILWLQDGINYCISAYKFLLLWLL